MDHARFGLFGYSALLAKGMNDHDAWENWDKNTTTVTI
jgi:hypothetical protein